GGSDEAKSTARMSASFAFTLYRPARSKWINRAFELVAPRAIFSDALLRPSQYAFSMMMSPASERSNVSLCHRALGAISGDELS
ncbi:MAG: hypothetical protein M3453_19730, partial [Pseudomonadota bacterium]|nr:hypothetical protein [Pseudomonadota bacterium]